MQLIFILLVMFQVKHFLADYPFQNEYMLGKFLPGWKFVKPLLAHVGVHAWFTLVICYPYVGLKRSLLYTLFDATAHFIMDRIKASPNLLGKFKALTAKDYVVATDQQKLSNTFFWWSLGLDQLFHHLTDLIIVYLVVSNV